MRHPRRHVAIAYLLAALLSAAVGSLRYMFAAVLDAQAAAIPFTIPIVIAAWVGGLGPGLLATTLSVVLLDALFFPARISLAIESAGQAVALTVFVASGVLISWVCQSLHDATRRAAAERERTGTILESISEAFYTLDRAWRFVYMNHEVEHYYGRAKDELLGRVIWDVFPQKRDSELQRRYQRATETGVAEHFEVKSPATGRWIEVNAYPSAEGLSVFFRDVTDRKDAERRLQAERERVQFVADAVPALISYIDTDCHYRLNNRAYEAWFGRPSSEIVGRHMRDVLGEAAWNTVRPHVERALGGQTVSYEAEAPYRDGGTRWISATYTPDVDESGRVRGLVAHVNDISAQKRSEQEREQSLATFNSLVTAAPLGITLLDREMRYQIVNGPLAAMNGLSAADHIGRHVRDVVPAICPQVEAAFQRALDGVRTPDLLVQAETPATPGTARAWRESWFPVPGKDGTVAAVGVIVEDITEQRRAQEELAYHRSLLQAITDNAQTGIVLMDGDGRGLFVNPAFEEITGYPAEQLIGRVLHDVVHHTRPDGEPYPIHDCPLVRALHLQRTVQGHEDVFIHEGGHSYPVRWSARPVFREGRPVGTVIEVWDITEAKESERRINDLVTVLREADRRKDEFLATLAHELRNPLAPVRNALEVLRRATDADTVAQARTMMERQVGQMVHLIDDLLDVSRITSGKVRLRRERLDVAQAVQSAVDATRPLIDASGHSLAVSLPREPVWVDADATRLVQVFSNLLANAAKYSERGGRIGVDVRRHGDDAVIAVRDSGIGIAPEHLPHLFEMFTQFAPALERSQGGLGIGLALVKGLLEMHGGTVEARSEGPGTGSEFVVRLPLVSPAVEEGPTGAVERAALEGPAPVRVLVVDDNRDSADSLAMLLELHGHVVETAHDGVQAVQAAAAFRPQIVLLDIGMPRMNGYETAAHIRAQLWGRHMVLVAMTGWGQEEDKRRTSEAGFDHHLTKPVDPGVLEQLVARVSVHGGRPASEPPGARRDHGPTRHR